VDRVIENLISSKAVSAVITGGEPLMYNLDYLCLQLKNRKVETFLETSGAFKHSGVWNWICLSPKRKQPPLDKIYNLANELKVIIAKPEDIEWAEINAKLVESNCKLYLQPEWSAFNRILPVIIDYIKINPSWSISLQAHKFMHIP